MPDALMVDITVIYDDGSKVTFKNVPESHAEIPILEIANYAETTEF